MKPIYLCLHGLCGLLLGCWALVPTSEPHLPSTPLEEVSYDFSSRYERAHLALRPFATLQPVSAKTSVKGPARWKKVGLLRHEGKTWVLYERGKERKVVRE